MNARRKTATDAERRMRVRQAQKDVDRARRALEKAGARLLKAISATNEEILLAADALHDMHHEADAEGCADTDWPARLAYQIQEQRESDRLDAEIDKQLEEEDGDDEPTVPKD